MSSNSKLDAIQKADRKAMRAQFIRDGGVIVRVEGVTVTLIRSGQSMGQFSVSVCSEDEKKDRRKVGEYHALNRFYLGVRTPVRLRDDDWEPDAEYLMRRAEEIAELIAYN